ncbi:MAG TPA: XRE family transcriptional regulator [Pseudomonadales bacterium]|nr:XRE family transcriptional regulator [Pseudomonadales bacterium]
MDEKSFREGRRITLNEVSEETGISRPTLTRISNVPGYNTNTEIISALCDYFEIEPGELFKRGVQRKACLLSDQVVALTLIVFHWRRL